MKRTTQEIIETTNPPTIAPSSRRSERKAFLMNEFNETNQEQQSLSTTGRIRQWIQSGIAPKMTVSLSGVAIAIALVFGFTALVTTPLTAERVLAQAASAYDDERQQGRYYYQKTRSVSDFGQGEQATIEELWRDTETGLERYQTSSEDGTVLNIFQGTYEENADGPPEDGYYYNDEAASKEFYGFGTNEDGEIESPDFGLETSVNMVIPNAEEAGLTFEDFTTLSPAQIDQTLTDAGFDTFFDKIYETTDFPAYELSGSDFDELAGDEASGIFFPPEIAYYNGEEFVSTDEQLSDISDDDFEEQDRVFGLLDDLRQATSSQARKELIQRLQTEDSLEFIEEQQWNGYTAVGIRHQQSFDVQFESTSVTYFDTTTFRIVGEEHTSISSAFSSVFTSIVVEENYSNDEPNFSTDGLSKEIPFEQIGTPEELLNEDGELRSNEEIEAILEADPSILNN